METNDKKGMARREFLKRLGVGTAATAAALTGCDLRRNAATGDRTAQGAGRDSDRPDDLPHQPQDGREGIAAGLRVHALADPQRRQRTRRRRRD